MATMNAGLIHSGGQPDTMNAFFGASRAAAATNAMRERQALNAFYGQHGDAVMAGDPEALSALASLGATGAQNAFDMRQAQRDQESRDRQFAINQETLDLQRQRFTMAAAEYAQKLSAEDLARQQAESQADFVKLDEAYAAGPEAFGAAVMSLPEEDRMDLNYDQWPQQRFVVEGFVEGLGKSKQSAKDAQIERLMSVGHDLETATNIADGVWVVSRDPQTGEAQIISKATGLPVFQDQAPAAQSAVPELSFGNLADQPAASQFGEQFADSNKAFGLGGFARAAANTASDAVGLGQPFPETAATQRDFSVVRETLTNMIVRGYPRQPPSWLLQQIQNLTPQPGVPWAGAGGARDQLAALGRSLEGEIEAAQNQLGTRKMRPNVRQQLEGQISSLNQALAVVAEAYNSFEAAEAPATDQSDIDLMNQLLADDG